MSDQDRPDVGPPFNETWFPEPPAPITPVPASQFAHLRGQRVIVGQPARGWRYDLRADDPVDRDGATLVPVLPELDWYRAELNQIETFAPLVPIAQVWVEQIQAEPSQPHTDPSVQHMLSRLVTLDAPPPRHALPARDVPGLTGRRLVLVTQEEQRRDLRAVSEPHQTPDHTICVRVTPEPDWYRWALSASPAPSTEIPIYLLWVE